MLKIEEEMLKIYNKTFKGLKKNSKEKQYVFLQGFNRDPEIQLNEVSARALVEWLSAEYLLKNNDKIKYEKIIITDVEQDFEGHGFVHVKVGKECIEYCPNRKTGKMWPEINGIIIGWDEDISQIDAIRLQNMGTTFLQIVKWYISGQNQRELYLDSLIRDKYDGKWSDSIFHICEHIYNKKRNKYEIEIGFANFDSYEYMISIDPKTFEVENNTLSKDDPKLYGTLKGLGEEMIKMFGWPNVIIEAGNKLIKEANGRLLSSH